MLFYRKEDGKSPLLKCTDLLAFSAATFEMQTGTRKARPCPFIQILPPLPR